MYRALQVWTWYAVIDGRDRVAQGTGYATPEECEHVIRTLFGSDPVQLRINQISDAGSPARFRREMLR